MKRRMAALLLCALLTLSGCAEQAAVQKKTEDSAGTGYGVTQKSALIMQDLYFLRPTTKKEEVLAALGTPQKNDLLAEKGQVEYQLTTGETLTLTYSETGMVENAVFQDTSSRVQDFFSYLSEQGILSGYRPGTATPGQSPEAEKDPGAQEPSGSEPLEPSVKPVVDPNGYFSSKRYTYAVAEQILKAGEERETVLSAMGKPNSFGSVAYEKDSYLLDVYTMEDGSVLFLDYGYARTTLRAVQKRSGSSVTTLMGSWGTQEKPSNFVRYTRNQQVFSNLKKNAKPSEIYRRVGEPDWLEGAAERYRDAYQLLGGAVMYLDFGPNHNSLTAVVMQKGDGTIVNYTLR